MSVTVDTTEDVNAWKLTKDGDLDISSNGVQRVLEGRGLTTYQSANVIIGTIKGSFPFIPNLGIELRKILGLRFSNSTKTSFEFGYELLTQVEMEDQDPYIIGASDYSFIYDDANRKVDVAFTVTIAGGSEFATSVVI